MSTVGLIILVFLVLWVCVIVFLIRNLFRIVRFATRFTKELYIPYLEEQMALGSSQSSEKDFTQGSDPKYPSKEQVDFMKKSHFGKGSGVSKVKKKVKKKVTLPKVLLFLVSPFIFYYSIIFIYRLIETIYFLYF